MIPVSSRHPLEARYDLGVTVGLVDWTASQLGPL
jgi:hypothetical protein